MQRYYLYHGARNFGVFKVNGKELRLTLEDNIPGGIEEA